MKKKRHRPSPAQVAARRKFAAKYGGKKHKAKASRSARSRKASGAGKSRPKKYRKSARRAAYKNPFLGGMITLGNPMTKNKKHGKKHHRRSSSLAIFKNPLPGVLAAPKEMLRTDFVTEAAAVAVGFIVPGIAMTYLPVSLRNAPWKGYLSKFGVIAALGGGVSLVSKRTGRAILLGGGVALLLDLYTDYVHPMIAGNSSGAGQQAVAADGSPAVDGNGNPVDVNGHNVPGVDSTGTQVDASGNAIASAPAAPAAPAGAASFFGGGDDPGVGAFWGHPSDPGGGMGAFFGNGADPGLGGLSGGKAIGEAFS